MHDMSHDLNILSTSICMWPHAKDAATAPLRMLLLRTVAGLH
jgi:hypothetical protein